METLGHLNFRKYLISIINNKEKELVDEVKLDTFIMQRERKAETAKILAFASRSVRSLLHRDKYIDRQLD